MGLFIRRLIDNINHILNNNRYKNRNNLMNINNLTVSFDTADGEIKAVDNVSFSLEDGEILALVGESGCGKTVLCKSLMGLLPENALVTAHDMVNENLQVNRRFAMVFQNPFTALDPTMRIGKQIEEAIRIKNKKFNRVQVKTRVCELLEQVGIDNPKERSRLYPHELSGGMRQRVVIAIALAADPQILLADEPTTALDVKTQAQILSLLKQLNRETGMSMIFVSHDLYVVSQIADRVVVMKDGRIVENGSVQQIFETSKSEYTKKLLEAARIIHGDKSNNEDYKA
ncbi:ABC transporter ATP-binding protein [Agathobacter sp.]